MMRGTTPEFTFTLPIKTEEVKTIEITFGQDDQVLVRKTNEDTTVGKYTITVDLTQEETFSFRGNAFAKAQVRLMTLDGLVPEIPPIMLWVEDSQSEEVLK